VATLHRLNTYTVNDLKSLDIALLSKAYNKLEHVKNLILEYTSSISNIVTLPERIYHFKNNSIPPLCICGNYRKYKNNGIYRSSCGSKECASTIRRQTCLSIHGVDNIAKSEKIQSQTAKTNMKKYGHENPMQNITVKERQKNTVQQKYGVDNISKSKDIKDKKRKTCHINFNVSYPMQSPIVQDKSKHTCNVKYGSDYWLTSDLFFDKLRHTCLVGAQKISLEVKSINDDFTLNCECVKNHDYVINRHLLYWRDRGNTILCLECNPLYSNYSSGSQMQVYDFIKTV